MLLALAGVLVLPAQAQSTDPPLTARFANVPESHDGSTKISFELYFSEQFRISYRTLRNEAFEMSGGAVTIARRLEKGSNIGWRITIEPDTDDDISVALPARACTESGAICTGDDRMLSAAVSATVPGPAPPTPEISIAPVSISVTEGTSASFTLSRTGDTSAALTVSLDVTEDGAVLASETPTQATFSAGSRTAAVAVATEDDKVVEAPSVVMATVATGNGYTVDANANSATVTVEDDDAAPVLASASIEDRLLTLSFDEALDEGSTPEVGAFAVAVDGTAKRVARVSISGSSVTLALGRGVVAGEDAVTVSYTVPTGANANPLRDVAGNRAAGFSDEAVTNDTSSVVLVGLYSLWPYWSEYRRGNFRVYLVRFGDTSEELTINVSVTETGSMLVEPPPTSFTFAAGKDDIKLEDVRSSLIEDDLIDEPNSEVTIAILDGSGYRTSENLWGGPSLTVRVSDDDRSPRIVTSSPILVGENRVAITALRAWSRALPSWSLVGGADADKVTLSTDGDLAFKTAKDFEAPDDADTDGDYEVEVRGTDGYNSTDAVLAIRLTDVSTTAAGNPAISGTVPQVGQVLTATKGTIDDDNGVPGTFTYHWVRVDGSSESDISGAVSSTYTLSAADAGKQIKVKMSFTDGDGNDEGPLASDAYPSRASAHSSRASVVAAKRACPTDADWCTELTFGAQIHEARGGYIALFGTVADGSLSDDTVSHGGIDYTLSEIVRDLVRFNDFWSDDITFHVSGGAALPDGTVVTVAGATLTVGADHGGADIELNVHDWVESWYLTWPIADLSLPDWVDGQKVTVSLKFPANAPPTGLPTISGTARVGETLTASVSEIADEDGLGGATFTYQWIRSDGSTDTVIADATQASYTLISADQGKNIKVRATFIDNGGTEEALTSATTAVAGPAADAGPDALTASFQSVPAEHDGSSPFKLGIAFSEGIAIGYRTFRDQAVSAAGGSVTGAKRVDGRKDLWEVTVEPGSLGDVTVTLEGGRACGTAGAVCTGDGRALSATISTTVLGPVALSVADARVREASDATLDFAVTLSRASSATVAVAYATADGSATAGSDYTARKGELTFDPGETEKTVSVPVLDDAHDEGAETLTLRLSAATGAVIADGEATGTIENTDHMPAAWLARFGRTVTDQVLEAVEARLAAPRAAGVRATLAGQALPSWDGGGKASASANAGDNASDRALRADARDRESMAAIRDWIAHAGTNDEWRGDASGGRVQSRALTGRDFLTGTSFALTGGSAEAGGFASLWGRGAISRFDGREGDLTLDGEVATGLMGADWAAERWTAGLAVGHARGTGGYREGGGCKADHSTVVNCAGEVEATLTGVWPYAGLKLTDRLSAWAAAGYGAGELKLTPGGETDGLVTDGPFTADLTMAMGAAGMRGEVLTPPPEGGLTLAVKGDVRFTRTASKATKDANGGKLEAATADVWLVRTGIDGSRGFAPGGDAAGMVLTPSFEIGVRLDGGDAESGLGVDLGGGLAFAAPKQGLALDLRARGLVAHEAAGFREWGAGASLAWDPRPSTDRGLALTLRQSWGGSPTGGMDALLGRETLAGLAANDNGDTTAGAGRLEAELGYGIALFGGGFTGTPHLGVGLSDTGRDYRLGWRLTSARHGDPGFEVGLATTRREADNADAEHGIALHVVLRW